MAQPNFPSDGNGHHEAQPGTVALPPLVEAENLQALYANFVRVAGTPEELVLDFGLNTQAAPGPSAPVKIVERIVVNHYTAKRLWLTLGAALKRHEQMFGVLETDISKRVLPPTARQ